MSLRNYVRNIVFLLVSIQIVAQIGQAQDSTWRQVLGGWVDDVYYENLFLGGSFYTRISLADIDDDGDLDMFYGGGDCGSLVYFENLGNLREPIFKYRYEEFQGLSHPGRAGSTVDVDFADLDDDGDLDAAFSSDLDRGGIVIWNDGTAQNADFVHRYPLGPLQGQSNVTFLDIDNDGDYDYFSGQGYRKKQIYYAENIGTPEVPLFEVRSDHYKNLDLGSPFNFDFGDLDNDGDYDLIVCKFMGNVALYYNVGSPDSAVFDLSTDNLFPQRDTTDWMETPELADIDNDGDLDLFLAGANAHLYYFENVEFDDIPQFVERSDTSLFYNFDKSATAWLGNAVDIDDDGDDDLAAGTSLLLNESLNGQVSFTRIDHEIPFNVGSFADIDADGDYDYIIPGGTHSINYFENIGNRSWPIWSELSVLFPSDGRLQYINTITSGDIDNDEDYDLLIGYKGNPNLNLYKNEGTPEVWEFIFDSELDLPQWEFHGPFDALLEDIDNDNDLDLLIGETVVDEPGRIRLLFYRNSGTPEKAEWEYVTDDFQSVAGKHRNYGIAPCLADLDKDGDKDLVISSNVLGLQLFLNPTIVKSLEYFGDDLDILDMENAVFEIIPKTPKWQFNISMNITSESYVQLKIFNIVGQFIDVLYSGKISKGNHNFNWDISNCSNGIYFIESKFGNISKFKKVTLLRRL